MLELTPTSGLHWSQTAIECSEHIANWYSILATSALGSALEALDYEL